VAMMSLLSWPVCVLLTVIYSSVQECVHGQEEMMMMDMDVLLVKIGGSSITNKGEKESLDGESLHWFAESISKSINEKFRPSQAECAEIGSTRPLTFVVVHGAGSFGHFTAKEFGLKGQTSEPSSSGENQQSDDYSSEHRRRNQGLAETRLSVQKLNHLVVSTFLQHGVNAVGISPCFGVPGLEAHLTLQPDPMASLEYVVRRTVESGLVPILHGDACLYGNDVGILSGDHIVEALGATSWVKGVIFITDVDGVFDVDPRENPNAQLIRDIFVEKSTGLIRTELTASGSSHKHDVTGGLQVRFSFGGSILSICEHRIFFKSTVTNTRNLSDKAEICSHHSHFRKECDNCKGSIIKRRASLETGRRNRQRIHSFLP
jgi:isopentenyl phosphate kinase